MLSPQDLSAIVVSLKLATTVTLLLLLLGLPLAWWLASTRSRFKGVVATIVAMPLVLPPTVLGFYLLVLTGPNGPVGALTQSMGLGVLPFTFWGLVCASIIYSVPFVVQPLQNAMEALGSQPLEVSATLGAGPVDRFFHVVIPSIKPGILTASVLGFAHTMGEFGVVLMMGGNIPGQTQVVSVQLYEHVEALAYPQAHSLAALLLLFSFLSLLAVYSLRRDARIRVMS